MSAPVIAFFNSKSRVGKTTLVYHLSWMYVALGLRVVAVDLDPQADLTAAFLDKDRLSTIDRDPLYTIFGAMSSSDIDKPPYLEQIDPDGQFSPFESPLALLIGDLRLSGFEDDLSEAWFKCQDQNEQSFRVMSAFWRIIQQVATEHKANVVLMDIGPNLGAINRAALIATDFIVVPVARDLFSLQGLCTLGPALHKWRDGWKDRITQSVMNNMSIPKGEMRSVGYIVVEPTSHTLQQVQQWTRWNKYISDQYRQYVLNEPVNSTITVINDPYCIARIKHYPSLMHLAQEAHKPMFYLKPADGAIGAHTKAVQDAYLDFRSLAQEIAQKTNLPLV